MKIWGILTDKQKDSDTGNTAVPDYIYTTGILGGTNDIWRVVAVGGLHSSKDKAGLFKFDASPSCFAVSPAYSSRLMFCP